MDVLSNPEPYSCSSLLLTSVTTFFTLVFFSLLTLRYLQQFFYLRLFLIKRHFSIISAIICATINAISAIFSAIGVNHGVIGINLTSINIHMLYRFSYW